MNNLQNATVMQRRLVFFMIMVGILMVLAAVTWLLISATVRPAERFRATALQEGATVREFAALPDDDSYPAAVAVGTDGTVYTGSYASGAVWRIAPDGAISEIPGTRDAIGAVAGLTVAPDGTVYVVDQLDTDFRSGGGRIQQIAPDGAVSVFTQPSNGFVVPDDIVVDGDGRVYVTDRGSNQVWRFEPNGGGMVWWWPVVPEDEEVRAAVTGLAYDATNNAVIVTDSERNTVYRIPVDDTASAEVIYQHDLSEQPPLPGLDGVTVAADGSIYVAALGENGVARVDSEQLTYVAGLFRGSSDVDFAAPNRLYVTNWDQSSLVQPLVPAQLPFAIDVIELGE